MNTYGCRAIKFTYPYYSYCELVAISEFSNGGWSQVYDYCGFKTGTPTSMPSYIFTAKPSLPITSKKPSTKPSLPITSKKPSYKPSKKPSRKPSRKPSKNPSYKPSSVPSKPSTRPTFRPSYKPKSLIPSLINPK